MCLEKYIEYACPKCKERYKKKKEIHQCWTFRKNGKCSELKKSSIPERVELMPSYDDRGGTYDYCTNCAKLECEETLENLKKEQKKRNVELLEKGEKPNDYRIENNEVRKRYMNKIVHVKKLMCQQLKANEVLLPEYELKKEEDKKKKKVSVKKSKTSEVRMVKSPNLGDEGACGRENYIFPTLLSEFEKLGEGCMRIHTTYERIHKNIEKEFKIGKVSKEQLKANINAYYFALNNFVQYLKNESEERYKELMKKAKKEKDKQKEFKISIEKISEKLSPVPEK